jgi:lipopolysaccharide transport system ATP-binding protein
MARRQAIPSAGEKLRRSRLSQEGKQHLSDIAISVENLSKSYFVGHNAERERYTALRDVIARHAHNFARKTKDMLAGRQIVQGDDIEEFWALKDVSFEIKRGEVLGVIGRNGAGKSTLLKVLSRITEPTKGRISITGRVASLLEVGTGFHPELTGRENIFLNGAILGMTRQEIKRKFDEIVDFAEIEKFLDTPVKRYSSGMYVRLAFAVAAHLEPEILIVDEVLAVGDAEFQKKCLGKMRDVAGHGRTILLVSHNMTAIQKLCDKAIWLHGGKVIEFHECSSVLASYMSNTSSRIAGEIDLSNQVRSGPGDARICLEKLQFDMNLPMRHNGPVIGQLCVRVSEPIDDVAFALGFSTPEGTRLLTYDSDLRDGSRFAFSRPGLYWINFSIDALPLSPDAYSLDVGCRLGAYGSGDYIPGVALLDVAPGSTTPLFISNRQPTIRLLSNWTPNSQAQKADVQLTELTS